MKKALQRGSALSRLSNGGRIAAVPLVTSGLHFGIHVLTGNPRSIPLAGLVAERESQVFAIGRRELRNFVDAHVASRDRPRRLGRERAEQPVPDREEETEVTIALRTPIHVMQVMDAADREMVGEGPAA